MMWGAAMAGWMWLGPLLVVAGLLAVGYLAVGRTTIGGPAGGSRARQVLDERYARGEIGEDEYRHRRDVLR